MFKGFKPQGLQKIATRMGYAGSMENFDEYLKQNPDKEREMIVYRARAQEMAKGGAVRKFQQGGFNPLEQNYKAAPMYDQFKQSDYYKNMPMVGPMIVGSSNINGQNYNFPMAMEAKAYSDYMKTLGNYQVGDSNIGGFNPFQAVAGPQVVVYGPDGTQYGNPQQAEAAGVTNYTMTQPSQVDPRDPRGPITSPVDIADPREEYMDYFRLPNGGKFAYDRRTRMAVPPGAVGVSKDEYMQIPDNPANSTSLSSAGQPTAPTSQQAYVPT